MIYYQQNQNFGFPKASSGIETNSVISEGRTSTNLTFSISKKVIYDRSLSQTLKLATYIILPDTAYLRSYALASASSTKGGPGSNFPGCLGALGVTITEGLATINYIQSSVNHKTLKKDKSFYDIARAYGGWRRYLLASALSDFESAGIFMLKNAAHTPARLDEILAQLSSSTGWHMRPDDKMFWICTPSNKYPGKEH